MLESKFQSELIKELRAMFVGCFILKNDPNYLQGFPDLLILFRNQWAVLEVKKSATAAHQPNQRHYVGQANAMSFGAFIFPENKEKVLYDLQQAFGVRR